MPSKNRTKLLLFEGIYFYGKQDFGRRWQSSYWDVREEGRLTDGGSTSGVEAAITIATKGNGEDED